MYGVWLIFYSVCVTSILRLTTIHQLSITDSTYTNVDSAIWTSVECSVAVISACLPTLKPLLRGLLRPSALAHSASPNRGGKSRHDSGYSSPSTSPAAQWRSAANEKRICDLDTSEFRRCDVPPPPPPQLPQSTEQQYSQEKQHGAHPVHDFDFTRTTSNGREITFNNGVISDEGSGSPAQNWDRV